MLGSHSPRMEFDGFWLLSHIWNGIMRMSDDGMEGGKQPKNGWKQQGRDGIRLRLTQVWLSNWTDFCWQKPPKLHLINLCPLTCLDHTHTYNIYIYIYSIYMESSNSQKIGYIEMIQSYADINNMSDLLLKDIQFISLKHLTPGYLGWILMHLNPSILKSGSEDRFTYWPSRTLAMVLYSLLNELIWSYFLENYIHPA